MMYLLIVIMLAAGFYTMTYGWSLWKEDNEKLAGAGAIAAALFGTLVPIVVLIWKR